MRRVTVACVLAVVIGALAQPARAHGGDADEQLYAPRSEPYGETYGWWAGAWTEWLLETPARQLPSGPEDCDDVQPGGDVWYLPFYGVHCEVPQGVAILVSPAGWECSRAEGNGRTYALMRRCAVHNFRASIAADTSLSIDGELISHADAYHFVSPLFHVDFVRGNLFGVAPGPSPAVAASYTYLLRPLAQGTHVVRFLYRGDVLHRYRITVG